MTDFAQKVEALRAHHEELLTRKNTPKPVSYTHLTLPTN